VLRLAVPVTVFLIIVGFSFWADIDKRVEVTLMMVLTVAATYLGTVCSIHIYCFIYCDLLYSSVIGQLIPMVGYLTEMDKFVSTAFGMLVVAACLQFLSITLQKQSMKYPMRGYYESVLTFSLRFAAIPMAMIIFMISFSINGFSVLIGILCFTLGLLFFINIRNSKRLRARFNEAVMKLRVKAAKVANITMDLIEECQGLKDKLKVMHDKETYQFSLKVFFSLKSGEVWDVENSVCVKVKKEDIVTAEEESTFKMDWSRSPMENFLLRKEEAIKVYCQYVLLDDTKLGNIIKKSRSIQKIAILINKLNDIDLSDVEVSFLRVIKDFRIYGSIELEKSSLVRFPMSTFEDTSNKFIPAVLEVDLKKMSEEFVSHERRYSNRTSVVVGYGSHDE